MTDHTYSVLMDGRVIVTHTDTEGVHPVYAITLMGNKLSQYMTDVGKETISESLEEARKVMGLALLREPQPPKLVYCPNCGAAVEVCGK